MRKWTICLALVLGLALALSGPSLAQSTAAPSGTTAQHAKIQGSVTSVDPATHSITIDNQTYKVYKKVDLSNIKPGDQVKATLHTHKGTQFVKHLKVVTPAPGTGAPMPPQ